MPIHGTESAFVCTEVFNHFTTQLGRKMVEQRKPLMGSMCTASGTIDGVRVRQLTLTHLSASLTPDIRIEIGPPMNDEM